MFISKPPIWNRLNSEHALARGLACAFYFRGPGDYYDLVTGSRVLPESADKRFVIGRPGRVAEFNGASNSTYDTNSVAAEYLPIKTSNGSYTGDFTLAVFSNPAAAGQIRFQAGQRRNSGSFSQAVLEANADSTLVAASSGRMAFGVYSGGYGGVVTHAGGVDGDWHLWVGTRIGTLHELYQDGVSVGTATATALAIGEANSNFGIGIRPDGANDYVANNQIGFVVAWNRGLSPGEVREFTRNPWALIGWPDTQVGSVAVGGAYTLSAEAGVFTLSGQAAGLRAARLVTGGAGAFTLSGQAAGLYHGRRVAAETGAFALLGQAATLRAARLLTAAAGSFALAGQAAGLLKGYRIAAETGAFTFTGQAATLSYTGLNHYSLAAAAGAFALTGRDAQLLRGLRLSAAAGAFTLTGRAATLSYIGAVVLPIRERCLAALYTAVAAAAAAQGCAAARNADDPVTDNTVIQVDGGMEIDLSDLGEDRYRCRATLYVYAVDQADGAALGAELADLHAALVAAACADRTLGGYADDVMQADAEDPDLGFVPGLRPSAALEIGLVIEFVTAPNLPRVAGPGLN